MPQGMAVWRGGEAWGFGPRCVLCETSSQNEVGDGESMCLGTRAGQFTLEAALEARWSLKHARALDLAHCWSERSTPRLPRAVWAPWRSLRAGVIVGWMLGCVLPATADAVVCPRFIAKGQFGVKVDCTVRLSFSLLSCARSVLQIRPHGESPVAERCGMVLI
jgi:hypothetical protein